MWESIYNLAVVTLIIESYFKIRPKNCFQYGHKANIDLDTAATTPKKKFDIW